MNEKRSGIVLFLVVVVMVLVLRALKREGESVKRERCSSSRDDDGSRPILIGRERGSIDRFLCSPKDDAFVLFLFFFGVLFDDVDQNREKKNYSFGRQGFFSLSYDE